jgi:1,4-dihydroxy-2-naphthoate octaprenyltransferase
MAIPVACTIFNVILINEFPDYVPDSTTGKRTLLVRLGKKKTAKVYAFAAAISWTVFFVSVRMYFPYLVAILYLPVCFLSAVVAVMMLIGYYDKHKLLMFMCGSTIIINLATTATYIAGVVLMNGKIQ